MIENSPGIEPQESLPNQDQNIDGKHKSKRSKLLFILAIVIISASLIAIVAFSVVNRFSQFQPKPSWATAFSTQPNVVVIDAKPIDDSISEWDQQSVWIAGGGEHWLGIGSVDIPNHTPARIWYDGKLLDTAPYGITGAISANGKHFIYTIPKGKDFNEVTLYKDKNKTQIMGKNIEVLGISDDGKEYYYTCEDCENKGWGLWKSGEYIGAISAPLLISGRIRDNYKDNHFLYSADGLTYCYSTHLGTSRDYRKVLYSNEKQYPKFEFCSPNAEYKAYLTSRSFISLGIDETLHFSNRLSSITEEYFQDLVLDSDGKASYLASDRQGGGELVLREKRYSLDGIRRASLFFSPKRHNLLLVSENTNLLEWYLNGVRLTGEQDVGKNSFQLTEQTLFIYRK